ncbi:MAG: DUF6198 family protein [Suipraeoptans sp.]
MNDKKYFPSELSLFVGVVLGGTGVALITLGQFGTTAVAAIPHTLYSIFPNVSFGTWYYGFQVFLMMLLTIIVKGFKKDFILSFATGILFSFVVDFVELATKNFPESFGYKVLYFTVGSLILMVGVAFATNSKLPTTAQDLFTREISDHFKWNYRNVKTIFDIVCVIVSIALALLVAGRLTSVGVGTIINAVINGIGINIFRQILWKKWNFNPIVFKSFTAD